MNYQQLLDYHKLYGTNKEDIIKRHAYEKVLKNVVIAPVWHNTLFTDFAKKIEQVGPKVYNVYGKDFSFSFIETNNIGSSWILEDVFALGVTNCKNLVFIGSAGSLDENIKIGDLVVPKLSYCGVCSTRFINDNLEDDFETKDYPNLEITNQLLNILKNNDYNTNYHYEENYSIDNIFTQFAHINHIKDLGAKTIEMETSAVFRACNLMSIKACALFGISDNTVINKSLYSGRTEDEQAKKKHTRHQVIPQVVIDLYKTLNKNDVKFNIDM